MDRQYIGRYRITGELGTGGMGTVVRAVDEVRHRDVAIKLPSDADPQIVSRLQRECDVLTQLEHHHIVQIYGSGSDPDLPFYIVMEYIEGTTIEGLLRQQGGPLEPRQALKFAQGVAEALAYAHKPPLRVIHRDIKPGNIIIRQKDGAVKVTDFGIAAVLSERAGSTAVGTMAYVAPEQALGQGADERSDLYSLGALLYEMLTGQRPPKLAGSPARPPSATPEVRAGLASDLLPRVDRLTLGLLLGPPNLRKPQRAVEVVEELRSMLNGSALPQESASLSSSAPYAPTQRASAPPHPAPVPPLPAPPKRAPQPPRVQMGRPVPVPVSPMVRVMPVQIIAKPLSSGKARASLVLGIFALLSSCVVVGGIPGVLAAIFGHLALRDIRRSGGRMKGHGLAIAGLVLGYFSIGLALLVWFSLRHTGTIHPISVVGWKEI
jgi:serine/threonine protein kinase